VPWELPIQDLCPISVGVIDVVEELSPRHGRRVKVSGEFRSDCVTIAAKFLRRVVCLTSAISGPRYRARVNRTNPSLPALVVCGPPASGKSTLARALASRLGAALLDQDVLTGPLTEVVARLVGTDDLDSPALASATRAARYETLAAGAADNLRISRAVVLVAPYSTERRDPVAWNLLAERLSSAGGTATLVWLRLSGDELLTRMSARAAGRDRVKLADRAAFLAHADLSEPIVPHIAVDATVDVEEQCGVVLAAIS
jgi:predicted kinase